MLVTARANTGDERDRGVIAHATSLDLESWQVHPPLSDPGAGFTHLEVPQVVQFDSRALLLFSCDGPALAGERSGRTGGIWALELDSPLGPFDVAHAHLLADERLYSGRAIRDREGSWVLLAFENSSPDGSFVGAISDPVPLRWDAVDSTIHLLPRSEELA